MTIETKTRTVAVVGAGPVGALAAVYFANRGWNVHVYETRPDMRLPENKAKIQNRSINLALSVRGLTALEGTGLALDELVLKSGLPMRGRMLHIGQEGHLISQDYGVHGECINSVDRAKLNEDLITAADKLKNVEFSFDLTLKRADFDNGTLELENKVTKEIVNAQADLIVGCDGAYSSVRNSLMRFVRLDFEQGYIPHGYCELSIPPKKNANGELEFAMNPEHLHIWPRHKFMMIALPNPDKSFTVTLFMPFANFEMIHNKDDLIKFFEEYFADAIELMGKDLLIKEYFKNPKGSLVMIRANPYHYKDRCIILGDAAHSMVPFYGQGMNCGFEDVRILDELLSEYHVKSSRHGDSDHSLQRALEAYTERRAKDLKAICELALYNYIEMRHGVTSPVYLMRKKIESWLHLLVPSRVIPLYTMVSFTNKPYSEALARHQAQGFWLGVAGAAVGLGTAAGLVMAGWRQRRQLRDAGELFKAAFLTAAQSVQKLIA
ncbi:kynurenine 3-monooxygenase, mitochondrial precursor [Mortierella polycephala]|uniref:Kynurenine 3-monooxygenase n=1 Tax=Mortierella polycephala TaxID=41804 RepID=A0A9P6PMN6_9FUNG|nr:kynurenine 3-monooxygenase, mitochondrial precursor [Mortierella polycephala]